MNENKRYLNNWNYNAALILNELETIVKNNGGCLCSQYNIAPKNYTIVNRTLNEKIKECESKVASLRRLSKPEILRKYETELEELTRINNEPITTHYGDYLYISFALNNTYYYLQFDSNPFFEFYFTKSRIDEDGQININSYGSELKKDWLYDCFFSFKCSNEDRREAANLIYNMLLQANFLKGYNDKRRNPFVKLTIFND